MSEVDTLLTKFSQATNFRDPFLGQNTRKFGSVQKFGILQVLPWARFFKEFDNINLA